MGRTSSKQKLGKKLRDTRKSLGLSQEQLGFSASVDRSYISEIENGLRNPSIETLEKLAKALKINLSELTGS